MTTHRACFRVPFVPRGSHAIWCFLTMVSPQAVADSSAMSAAVRAAVVRQQCRDCGAGVSIGDGDTEQVLTALLEFREAHRFCSYGAPFGPIPQQRRSAE